jgi:hypothetical protein
MAVSSSTSAAFLTIYPDAPELEDFDDFEDDEER